MSFSTRLAIVAVFAVVSSPARSAVGQVPGEIATDRMSYTGAGAASCTHPLFVNPRYDAGNAPWSVAIGDLDGVNGPDLAVANSVSDDVSVLLNLCTAQVCPWDLDGDVGIGDFLIVLGSWGGPGGDTNGDGTTDIADFLAVLGSWGPCP